MIKSCYQGPVDALSYPIVLAMNALSDYSSSAGPESACPQQELALADPVVLWAHKSSPPLSSLESFSSQSRTQSYKPRESCLRLTRPADAPGLQLLPRRLLGVKQILGGSPEVSDHNLLFQPSS